MSATICTFSRDKEDKILWWCLCHTDVQQCYVCVHVCVVVVGVTLALSHLFLHLTRPPPCIVHHNPLPMDYQNYMIHGLSMIDMFARIFLRMY